MCREQNLLLALLIVMGCRRIAKKICRNIERLLNRAMLMLKIAWVICIIGAEGYCETIKRP